MLLRYANPELWQPTPHVKDIPGGHPHLPQTIIIIIIFIVVIIIIIIIIVIFIV